MICPHCHKDTEQQGPAARDQGPDGFDAFWQLFPRKVAKASALKAWRKVALNSQVKDQIMLGLSRAIPAFRQHIAKDGRQYIPHAATWLNGRRWEDEAGARGQAPAARAIECELCGDSGLFQLRHKFGQPDGFTRCSCARGQLPGLVVPQSEASDSTPF